MTATNREELASTLFEEAGDALFLFDPESECLLDVNPMAQRLTGFSRRELLQKPVTYLVRAEVQGGLDRLRQAFRRTGLFHSQEGFWLRHQQDGRWTPVNLTITRLHTDPRPVGLITARDITERREAHAQLKKMETELRRVLSSVPDCLWSAEANEAGRWSFRYLSPVVEKLTGRPPAFFLPDLEKWLTIVHPEDRPRAEQVLRQRQGGQSGSLEYRVLWPDGAPRWVRDSVIATRSENSPSIILDGVLTDITEEKRAEDSLRESETRHRLVLEQIPAIVWTTDGDLHFTTSTGAGFARFQPQTPLPAHGATGETPVPQGVIGISLYDYFQTRDPDFLPIAAHRWALQGEATTYDFEWQGCSWHTHVEPLKDSANKIIGVIGVALDITDRIEAEKGLREREERLRLLVDKMPAILWTTDYRLRFTSSVGAGLATLGLKTNELVGASLMEHYGTDNPDYPPLAAHLRALRGEPTSYEMIWQGQIFETHVEPLLGPDGTIHGCIGVALNITERKKAESELHKINTFLDSIVENIPNMLFVKEAENLNFERVNKAAEVILGHPREELVGKDDYQFFPRAQADFFVAMDRRVLRDKQLLDIAEETVHTPKGERILHTKKIPLLDEKGEAKFMLGISEDITDRKRLEDQLRQSQKMEAVGQLAGGIAHDFNNLLTAILGNVGLALGEVPAGHPCQELLAEVEKAGRRAAELVRQLVGFSRRALLRIEPVDLNASIEETVRLLRRTIDPRITVETRWQTGLWPVKADATQIGQVLMNLCLNARDAMPEGGSLTLETANLTLDEEKARKLLQGKAGDFVRLSVSDTGQGMPAEVREHLFEPFFTTKEIGKGTGLGLAMVFGIVQQHGGWIQCQSEEGKGTRFDIFLPRFLGAPAPIAIPTLGEVQGGNETILLVDDQEMILRLGREILSRRGYRVLTAGDGVEAVELYRRLMTDIDLVILDRAMPRLSGPEALKQLRQINADVCVLFSSGYPSEDNSRGEISSQLAGFVAKPYRPIDLARSVREALDCRTKK
jgi:PAS domain S-box-containing protein